jgi:ubiquinone/menaquinone biosynthesis C-methylase UbiE
MKPALLEILVDPVDRKRLRVEEAQYDGEAIIYGKLHANKETLYEVQAGIPRFVISDRDAGQQQTSEAFSFKWKRRDTYDSLVVLQNHLTWMLKRYGFSSQSEWVAYYSQRDRILDLGCGSGFSSSAWIHSLDWRGQAMWVGVEISEAIDVAQERLGHLENTHFVQADALYLPFPDATFDIIFSEGVLHHTPSTRQGILSAARVLRPGGEFHFYVYRRKGPAREFTDDYIRAAIAPMSDEEAWQAMESLTQLGKALSDLHVEVEVGDVPLLGIKAGRYDIQRLIYWHFAKLYWNENMPPDWSTHVN